MVNEIESIDNQSEEVAVAAAAAAASIMIGLIEQETEDEDCAGAHKAKQRRRSYPRPKYMESAWGQWLRKLEELHSSKPDRAPNRRTRLRWSQTRPWGLAWVRLAAQALCWIPLDWVPYWLVGRAGRFAWCAACQVERAGEGMRVRFFALAWGWPERLNFEPTRLRIPPVPCTKFSSPHNARAQKVLLTKVSDQKLPENFNFFTTFCSHKNRSNDRLHRSLLRIVDRSLLRIVERSLSTIPFYDRWTIVPNEPF